MQGYGYSLLSRTVCMWQCAENDIELVMSPNSRGIGSIIKSLLEALTANCHQLLPRLRAGGTGRGLYICWV